MENQQMAMPAEMAPAGPNPDEMAIYEQMRQQISPQEFSNEMLASASQIDPQAVAEFTEELQSLDVSAEELDALNDLVDEILANPEQYEQLRQKYLAQGLPDDILPEQFDPNFFAAMNMAVDQMIAAPTGVQAFAEGGIAELKPIAKAIASYGRNGDTMLAHITPAEARMLRRRGGSGTINPHTGLPEFFLKKAFKSIGKAVKKFASSTVGRLVTTVALGFFLGPAAASMLGATSVAGVAAVSGFVGSAGATLLGGGNLKDALKAGAVGGLTAGAGAGIMGGSGAFQAGSYSGAGLTPGQAVQSQFDKFKSAITPGAPSVPGAPAIAPTGEVAGQMPVDASDFGAVPDASAGAPVPKKVGIDLAGNRVNPVGPPTGAPPPLSAGPGYDPTNMAAASPSDFGAAKPTLFEQGKQFYSENISPSGIRAAGQEEALNKTLAQFPGRTAEQVLSAPANSELGRALARNSPGFFQTYAPITAVGLGTMAAFGGFDTKPVQGGDITNSLMKPVTQRIRESGTQRERYMQGLPGVVYDDFGAPVYGQSTRLPTYDVPDYNSGGFGSQGQGIMNLPSIYIPPPGTIGSRSVAQPYNNADMYSNLVPRGYEDGGEVAPVRGLTPANSKLPANFNWEQYVAANPDLGRAGIDTREEAQTHWLDRGLKENRVLTPEEGAQREATRVATLAQQQAARDKVAQAKAMRRAQGSGAMYANINAGLSALAPETNPMDTADTTFGSRNRQAQLANLQQTYAPMLQGQRNAMIQQSAALGQPARNIPSPLSAPTAMDRNSQLVQDQYARIGRTGFGGQTNQIDIPGFTGFVNQLQAGQMSPADLPGRFDTAVQNYMQANPNDRYTQYVQQFQNTQAAPVKTMNMGGIAGLAQGGYPRRTGQISGPGTEKSDSIPAMLSDGEFVMTAKAVRGAGKGSRRAGAKQMYKLMHQLEKNAERG